MVEIKPLVGSPKGLPIVLVERVGGDFYVFAPKDNKTNRRPLLPSSGIHVIPLMRHLSAKNYLLSYFQHKENH